MAMNPLIIARGSRPDFSMSGLPANPNPERITNALWWLVQMRLRLEPLSENGGILAIKPGYHSYGSRLPDHGQGNSKTDHSIRRAPDRRGPWWESKASAHDWTFTRAHGGNYTEISKYCNRLRNAMRDPNDLRPDNVYAYFIGQIDNDRVVEGYNEYNDDEESGDSSHLWHRHDSFRRDIVGDYWAMWKALTIDMGWTYAEWQRSVAPVEANQEEEEMGTPAQNADATWNKKFQIPGTTGPENQRTAADMLRYLHSLEKIAGRVDELVDEEGILVAVNALRSEVTSLSAQVAALNARLAGGEQPPTEG